MVWFLALEVNTFQRDVGNDFILGNIEFIYFLQTRKLMKNESVVEHNTFTLNTSISGLFANI